MSTLLESDEAFDEAADEAWPDEANDESFDEAARRTRPVRTAPRASAYRPRVPSQITQSPVTQHQLQAVLARVSQQIGVNSAALKNLDGKLRSVSAEQTRQTTTHRKEAADHKKDLDGLRRDLKSTRELSALVGVISSLPAGAVPSTLQSLAPLAMLLPTDFLNATSSGASGSGSSHNYALLAGLALVVAIQQGWITL